MQIFEIILIAISLAIDSSAVALVAAAEGYVQSFGSGFRLIFYFGLFQGGMPIIGWLLGRSFVQAISALDHWIAFILLAFVATKMIQSGFTSFQHKLRQDPTRGIKLIALSLATSIDALAIGLSFSVLSVWIFYPSLIIGVVTTLLCMLAILVGKKIGTVLGQRMEIIGGFILLGIGIRIVISHLWF